MRCLCGAAAARGSAPQSMSLMKQEDIRRLVTPKPEDSPVLHTSILALQIRAMQSAQWDEPHTGSLRRFFVPVTAEKTYSVRSSRADAVLSAWHTGDSVH